MSSLTVALTGGLASGKSTVGRWLAEAGMTVVDADRVVADLYRPGGPGARAAEELFGPEVLDENGAVDHRALAERVFADGLARRRLEEAIHPLVREHFARLAEGSSGIVVLEVPLLLESGMAGDFDLVVTVEANPELRVERAVERGLDPEAARARIAAQTSESVRRGVADVVLDNDSDLESLRRRVEKLIIELRRRADD